MVLEGRSSIKSLSLRNLATKMGMSFEGEDKGDFCRTISAEIED